MRGIGVLSQYRYGIASIARLVRGKYSNYTICSGGQYSRKSKNTVFWQPIHTVGARTKTMSPNLIGRTAALLLCLPLSSAFSSPKVIWWKSA